MLDRDLPVVHGDDVCRAILTGESSARVLMLTASAELTDKVAGLGLGADDYLTKPFAFAELIARVQALAWRAPRVLLPVLERLEAHRRDRQRKPTADSFAVPVDDNPVGTTQSGPAGEVDLRLHPDTDQHGPGRQPATVDRR